MMTSFIYYEGNVEVQTYSLLGRRKEKVTVEKEQAVRLWEKETKDGFPAPALWVHGERVEGY